MRLNGLKIVIDCANGAAYQVAPSALWEMGAEMVAIGVNPNGPNINDHCGSTSPALLQETVVASARRHRHCARWGCGPADHR